MAMYVSRGVFHVLSGKPCEDAAIFTTAGNGNRILAISDGCSASRHARAAALANLSAVQELFTAVPLRRFLALPNAVQRHAVIGMCTDRIRALSERLEDPLRQAFGATLLFAVRSPGCSRTLVGHLGDGSAYICCRNGLAPIHSAPERIAGSTVFTATPNAAEHLRLYALRADGVLLTTDGADEALSFAQAPQRIAETLRCEDDFALTDWLRAAGNDPNLRTDDWGVATLRPDNDSEPARSPLPDTAWERFLTQRIRFGTEGGAPT